MAFSHAPTDLRSKTPFWGAGSPTAGRIAGRSATEGIAGHDSWPVLRDQGNFHARPTWLEKGHIRCCILLVKEPDLNKNDAVHTITSVVHHK